MHGSNTNAALMQGAGAYTQNEKMSERRRELHNSSGMI